MPTMAEDPTGEGDRIARLLEEVRAMAGPTTWQRVDDLVHRLVRLYGAGLDRLLEIVSESGKMDRELEERLCGDELVSSLLLLHGLHPVPPRERVERAIEELRRQVAPDAVLELVTISDRGVVRLELSAGQGGCPSSIAALARAVEQRVIEAAPEVTAVEFDGLPGTAGEPRERLVTLGRPRGPGEVAVP